MKIDDEVLSEQYNRHVWSYISLHGNREMRSLKNKFNVGFSRSNGLATFLGPHIYVSSPLFGHPSCHILLGVGFLP